MKPWQIRQSHIAQRVTELRGDRTKTAFAKHCGITTGTLRRVESATQLISPTAAEKIDTRCGTGGELARMRQSVIELKEQLPDVPKKTTPPAGEALTDEQRHVVATVGASLKDAVRAIEAALESVGDPDSPFTAMQVFLYQSRCRFVVTGLQNLADDLAETFAHAARTPQ